MKKRICNKCRVLKNLSSFSRSSKDGHVYSCKECSLKLKYEWRKKNPEKDRAQQHRSDRKRTEQRAISLEARRKYQATQRRIKYGISNSDYDRMFDEQSNVCAICKCSSEKTLCIDHNHETGKVRGLLCHRCNLVIGNAKENINTLEESIRYLQKHEN